MALHSSRMVRRWPAFALLLGLAGAAAAQDAVEIYEPRPYQEGRDVVWVPTPDALVETMLDMAQLAPHDVVIDLGSGDGRNVIAAARRGARAHGVEFDANLVALAKRNAASAGVADRATFSEGDMFEADISQATVLPLFLLEENLARLVPKFLALKPGARIVNNSFKIEGWEPDETRTARGGCERYCTAHLYIVPARVAGAWRFGKGVLMLEQRFQAFTGTLFSGGEHRPVEDGRLRGETISFRIGETVYSGRVAGDAMAGETRGSGGSGDASGAWTAARPAGAKPRD